MAFGQQEKKDGNPFDSGSPFGGIGGGGNVAIQRKTPKSDALVGEIEGALKPPKEERRKTQEQYIKSILERCGC